jgi:hypothetical protein
MTAVMTGSIMDHSLFGVTSSSETADLTTDLAKAQAEYPAISKTGENKFGKYHYLTYAGICEALRGPLTKHGLALPQIGLCQRQGEWIAVGILRHKSGQFITSICPIYLGVDKGGEVKQDMQSLGSAYTYAKKYLLLGLVGGWAEEDDDGQRTMPEKKGDKSLEIEQAAKHQLDKAKNKAEVKKVVGLVKLRVSERVCSPGVLDRVEAYAANLEGGRDGKSE